MFANTEVFFILLAFSLAVGAALGMLYDVLMLAVDMLLPEKAVRPKRVQLPHNAYQAERALFPIEKRVTARDVTLFFTDTLFFTVSALAVIILLYHLNYGEVRAFSLISALTGFVVYRKTLGKPLLFLMKRVIIFFGKTLKKVKGILNKLLRVLLKPVIDIVKRAFTPTFERLKLRKIKKKARKCLAKMEENEEKRAVKRKQSQ